MRETFESLVDYLMGRGFFMVEAVEILEKTLIQRALEKTGGNRSEASKLLGIHRNTLQRKMSEFALDGGAPRRKPPSQAAAPPRRAGRRRLPA